MEASLTIVFLALIAASTVFWLWALVDGLRQGSRFRAGSQLVWVIVIAFTHTLGALLYVAVGRPERSTVTR